MTEKKNEAALRANDPADFDERTPPGHDEAPRRKTKQKSELDEASAESGPELRDIPMPDGIDRADGN